jgi:dienelactone hydrolase
MNPAGARALPGLLAHDKLTKHRAWGETSMGTMCKWVLAGMMAGFTLGAAAPAVADEALASLPARIELIPFESLTLPDSAFLKGDKSVAKPTLLAAELHIAQGAGKRPLVVLLHGSGALNGGHELWTREFAQMGVSTLMIDAFTGRGIVATSDNQGLLGRLNMVLDTYRALDRIKDHPRVDTSRVALIGFSRGGQSTLYASLERFHAMWNQSGVDFAAYFPFYADCVTTFVDDTKVKPVPIRMHHGDIDDYNPAAQCVAFVDRLKAAGRDVQISLYKDAAHSFDGPLGPPKPTLSARSMTVRNCVLKEEPLGQITNMKTGQAFTYTDPCVERGPHAGYNAEAGKAARASVRESLRTIFKL